MLYVEDFERERERHREREREREIYIEREKERDRDIEKQKYFGNSVKKMTLYHHAKRWPSISPCQSQCFIEIFKIAITYPCYNLWL